MRLAGLNVGMMRKRLPRLRGSAAGSAAVALDRRIEAPDQGILIEGLGQKANGSIPKRASTTLFFRNGSNENKRYAVALIAQVRLQIDPAHPGHADIGNHAPRLVQLRRLQKGFGGGKNMGDVSERHQEILYRNADGFIIINN